MPDLTLLVQNKTLVLLTAATAVDTTVTLKCSQTNYLVPLQTDSCSLRCCFMTLSSSTNQRICVVLKQGEDQHQQQSVYDLRHVYCLGLSVTLIYTSLHFISQSINQYFDHLPVPSVPCTP